MSVSYTRTLASFPAGLNPDRFTQEIRDSAAILIALDYLQIEPPDIQIWFKASLTSPEIAALDALIAAHSGLPLPDAALQVFITDESDKTITGAIVYDRANGGSLSIPAGSSFPVTPVAGELFWRTDTNALYRRNAGNTSWDQVAASVAGADHGALAGLGDDDHTQYQLRSEKGVANGYAGLQAGGDISDATHGSRGGGSLHASATTSVAGFLSAADKTKLDGVATGATNTPLTSSAPADVTKAAAAVGVATSAARADHKHDVSTAAPGSVTIGAAAAEGTATSLARSDHTHALAAPATPQTVGTANATGSATSPARADHVHAHGAQTDGTLHAAAVPAGASGFMTGADKSKLDGVAAGATNTPLTSSAPVNVTKAAAAVGVATAAARADHKHDISTAAPAAAGLGTSSGEGTATTLARSDHTHQANTAPVNVTKAAAAIGTSTEPARADHKHDVTTAAPAVGIGGGNSEGSAASLARSDHGHALRETGGPSDLTIGAIADGQFVKRVGSALVGVAGAGASVLVQTQSAQVVADTSTTSLSFVDLLTVNITTGANAVIIRAMGHVSNANANVNMRLRVLVDDVSVGGGQVRCPSTGIGIAFALQFKTGVLSAGAHVIKLQWATVSSTMRCRPVAAANSETASLVVEEVTV